MRRWLIAVGLAGCGFSVDKGGVAIDAPNGEGPVDAEIDAFLDDALSFDVNTNQITLMTVL